MLIVEYSHLIVDRNTIATANGRNATAVRNSPLRLAVIDIFFMFTRSKDAQVFS